MITLLCYKDYKNWPFCTDGHLTWRLYNTGQKTWICDHNMDHLCNIYRLFWSQSTHCRQLETGDFVLYWLYCIIIIDTLMVFPIALLVTTMATLYGITTSMYSLHRTKFVGFTLMMELVYIISCIIYGMWVDVICYATVGSIPHAIAYGMYCIGILYHHITILKHQFIYLEINIVIKL